MDDGLAGEHGNALVKLVEPDMGLAEPVDDETAKLGVIPHHLFHILFRSLPRRHANPGITVVSRWQAKGNP